MKYLKQLLLICLLLFAASPMETFAKKDIDVKSILWGHIKDSYDWHVTKVFDKEIIIHLPVIVKSHQDGWVVFCSSAFSEEPDANGNRQGPHGLYIKNPNAEVYPNKICETVDGKEARPLDISITKTTCFLFINAILLLVCILIPASWYRKRKAQDPAPKGFVGLMDIFVMHVYNDIVKPVMGEESDKYAPYLLTCFFFIFTANVMGVIPFPPGGGNLTGNIACTFFLGTATFLVVNLTGNREYWKEIFWPDVPTWLKVPVPLMPIIELFGIFTKPLALIMRLFANMLAGHAIALSFAAIIFIMFNIGENMVVNYVAGGSMTVFSIVLSVFMMLLEFLVCYIQALVFTMLSGVFISMAHPKAEHERA